MSADDGGLPITAETTASDNTEPLLREKHDHVSELCGCDMGACAMRPMTEIKMQQLQQHDGQVVPRYKLFERAAGNDSDHSTTVHLYVGLGTAKDYTSSSSGTGTDEHAAAITRTFMIKGASKHVWRSKKPRKRGTATIHTAKSIDIQDSNQHVRYKSDASVKLDLKSACTLDDKKRSYCDSSPSGVVFEKHRQKVKRKAEKKL